MARKVVGIRSQEALDLYERQKMMNNRDKRLTSKDAMVCICGHALRIHQDVGIEGVDRKLCSPGRQKCPCKTVRPVLASTNLRVFMGRTDGVGASHALGKGLAGVVQNGSAEAYWLVDGKFPEKEDGTPLDSQGPGFHGYVKCDICLQPTDEPVPVAVGHEGVVSEEPTGIDKLVCFGCFVEWDSE